MAYKKCGFRDKIHVCKFREEDCTPDKCDMYNIAFEAKIIKKMIDKERKAVKKYHIQMKELRKKGLKATDEYKKAKAIRKDKVCGLIKLTEAYMYLKRIKIEV